MEQDNLDIQCTSRALKKARSGVYEHIKRGLMTRPIAAGAGNRVVWPAHEVRAIVDARNAGASDDQLRALVHSLETERARKLPIRQEAA